MAKAGSDEVWVQLTTRIPKTVHRAVRLRCVTDGTSLQDFVVAAVRERLMRESRRRRGRG